MNKKQVGETAGRGVLFIKGKPRPDVAKGTLASGASNPSFDKIKHLLSGKPLRPPVRE